MVNETVSPFGFPAESFLTEHPPDYPTERFYLGIKLALVTFFFLVYLPQLFAKPVEVDHSSSETADNKNDSQSSNEDFVADKATPSNKNKKKQRNENYSKKSKKPGPATSVNTVVDKTETKEVVYELSPLVLLQACFLCVVFVVVILLRSSPDNYYTSRSVFEAPLLTREECEQFLYMADLAAEKNANEAIKLLSPTDMSGSEGDGDEGSDARTPLPPSSNAAYYDNEYGSGEVAMNVTIQNLLLEPKGWQKMRHGSYPTTDLNLVTDPFTKDDRAWLKKKLDARLSPILERIYGVPPAAIRANDMFVVRYDDDKRTHLVNHTDDSSISFNILLNDGFEGGGTRLWNRWKQEPFAHVNPSQVGNVLLHSAMVNHEGVHVTKGTRIILVGFLSVDRVDPWSFQSGGNSYKVTRLSWWASWGSLNWCCVKFKEGIRSAEVRLNVQGINSWRNHRYIRALFNDMFQVLAIMGDMLLPHRSYNLIQGKDREAYIDILDAQYEDLEKQRRALKDYEESTGVSIDYDANRMGLATWFQGQQINVDITGAISSTWRSRQDYIHRFIEEEL